MRALEWRVKLAVLWFAQAVNYAAYVLIAFAETGSLGTVGTGETGLLLAIFFFIPCALAWLSFVVQPAVSRWPHLVFGTMFAVIKLGATLGLTGETPSTAILLNELWAFVAAALIVWCARRYPKSEP
jgi:hypothetical protein